MITELNRWRRKCTATLTRTDRAVLVYLDHAIPVVCSVCGWDLPHPGEAYRVPQRGLVHVSCAGAESAATRGGR